GRPLAQDAGPQQPAMLAYARPIQPTAAAAPSAPAEAAPALLLEVLDDDQQRSWTEDELLLVEQVTGQLTLALENARLFEESRLRSEQLAVLNEMSRNLSAQLNLQDVITTVYQYASRLLDTTNFYVALYNPEAQEVSFPFAVEENTPQNWRARPLGNGLTENIIRSGQPVLIKEDVAGYLRQALGIEMYGRLPQCWLGVPLGYSGQVIGVMAVQSYDRPQLYNESHRDLLAAIASQAAVALQNARLYSEERRRRQIADALSGIARAISATLEAGDIAQHTLEQLAQLVPYNRASLRLLRQGRLEPLAQRSLPAAGAAEGAPAAAPAPFPEPLLAEMLMERSDLLAPDTAEEPRTAPLARAGVRSWIAAPLVAGDQVVGVIEAGHDQPGQFTTTSLEMLRTVAAQIAVAIQNANLFQETQTTRDALQVSVRYQESLARAVAALTERGIAALPEVLETLGQAAQASRAYYFETQADHNGPFWRLTAEWRAPGIPAQLDNPTLRRIPAESLTPWLEQFRSVGFVSAQTRDLSPEDRLIFDALGADSVLQFMVTSRHNVPGCIGFAQSSGEREWTIDEIAALQTAASALSSTIAREDLFSQVQANLAETEAQYQASARLNSAGSHADILGVLRQFTILGHLNAASITINLFDRPWITGGGAAAEQRPEWLIPIARWSARSVEEPPAERYPIAQWSSAEALMDPDRPTIVADVESDPRLDDQARQIYQARMGARSLLYSPLNVAGRWIGHIIALYRRSTSFPEQEVRRLASLAGQAAVAIEGLRLLDETRQRNEELAALNQVTGAVSRTLEIDEVLGEILSRVLAATSFDAGLISIANPVDQRLAVAVQHG
ncbi:MAG: GAF domain-containing protein, partial [Chloroflexota bacterium]